MSDKDVVKLEETKVDNWQEALEKECWVAPVVDIYETTEDYTLIACMPGVSKENVKIKMEDGNLIVMGKVDYDTLLERNYVLNESQIGNFFRKFQISESIDDSRIEAKLENGQLIVNLPKHERAKPKNIEIK
ncbi:MAG: Hsp20/alpha crystallin family protein [Ignavibacteriales bacterium]|nr:MAG: Hsp20/alpha crystallin family protein [Ignavibacteriales bacterium]